MRRKCSDKTVNDLSPGRGKGIIETKENNQMRVTGEIVIKNGKKNLIVLQGNQGNPGTKKLSFGGGTIIKRWKRI